MNVLFVHGYSETSLGCYYDFPQRLTAAMPGVTAIVLSAFRSLDDTVTIDDLALAMEGHVFALAPAFTTVPWSVICHSTGALIARRWLLNRLANHQTMPTHLITMAGANQGSTLAQMGKSVLGYVQKLFAKHSTTVGANVLADLDYGSDFLLKLNTEWMHSWNDGSLDDVYAFSAGGDYVGNDKSLDIFWQTHEPGSDNTVRISGANLNCTIIEVNHVAGATEVVAIVPKRPVPHLILKGYSHFGSDTGILGWVKPGGDEALAAVVQALRVASPTDYAAVQTDWRARTEKWSAAAEAAQLADETLETSVNSTLVFSMRDESGRPVDDCVIVILDQAPLGIDQPANLAGTSPNGAVPVSAKAVVQLMATAVANVSTAAGNTSADAETTSAAVMKVVAAANSASKCIMTHSPIQNDVQRGSYSFYIDYTEYVKASRHWFHADALLTSPYVAFLPMTFTQPPNLLHTIRPNEFTYVSLKMQRDVNETYATYKYSSTLDLLGTAWTGLFPRIGRLN